MYQMMFDVRGDIVNNLPPPRKFGAYRLLPCYGGSNKKKIKFTDTELIKLIELQIALRKL